MHLYDDKPLHSLLNDDEVAHVASVLSGLSMWLAKAAVHSRTPIALISLNGHQGLSQVSPSLLMSPPASAGAQEFMREHEKAMEHNDKVLAQQEGEAGEGGGAAGEAAPSAEGGTAEPEEAPAKKSDADALADQVRCQGHRKHIVSEAHLAGSIAEGGTAGGEEPPILLLTLFRTRTKGQDSMRHHLQTHRWLKSLCGGGGIGNVRQAEAKASYAVRSR